VTSAKFHQVGQRFESFHQYLYCADHLEAACFVQAPNRLGYQTCYHNYHINTVRIAERGINDPEGPLRAENMAENAYFSEI
jgi:hypothetical protein